MSIAFQLELCTRMACDYKKLISTGSCGEGLLAVAERGGLTESNVGLSHFETSKCNTQS